MQIPKQLIELKENIDKLIKKESNKESIEIQPEYKTVRELQLAKIKELEKKQKVKHYSVVALIALCLFGGFKGLFPTHADSEALSVSETQTFVKTYAANYFTYPSTETLDTYFKTFSLNPAWRIQYDTQKISTATANNIEIYKVNSTENSSYADYYLYLTQHLKLKDENTKQTTYNVRIRLYHEQNGGYLVTQPVSMRTLDVPSITDDKKSSLTESPDKGSEQITEDEKKELMNTITLFLDTYSSSYEQAQLLTDLPHKIDALDPNTRLVLKDITSGTKSSNTYYVEATIEEILDETITNNKTIHFEVNISDNKITEMEEY